MTDLVKTQIKTQKCTHNCTLPNIYDKVKGYTACNYLKDTGSVFI